MSNYKRKRAWKTIGIIVAIIAILALVGGIVGVGIASLRERNPENLIELDDNYIRDTRTNYGLDVKVDEFGVIKLKGQTTVNEVLTVQKVKLPAGEYTISGIKEPALDTVLLRAIWGEDEVAMAGLEGDTFVLDEETEVTVEIFINGVEDKNTISWANRTIKPVIVEGDEPGEFYK